jgi:Zn-dependent protease with chaperone function
LWDLAQDVSEAVGTRGIDEIRVTPGTEMAVYERGSARERSRDEGRRILVLGVGLLQGFRQDAFRAVLAHEYGHFSHRDTAGGDVALRVMRDMMNFAIAMAQHGQAVSWNLAFQFLRVYSFLFRRITHGATRLQEVLADRVAAHNYGGAQFEEGLRHVIRRDAEFHFAANREIELALQSRRPFQNVYDLQVERSDELERAVTEALNRPTTEDDTHPGPQDRFRLVAGVSAKRMSAGTGMVWDLYENPVSLTMEMTTAIQSRLMDAAPAPA